MRSVPAKMLVSCGVKCTISKHEHARVGPGTPTLDFGPRTWSMGPILLAFF